MRELFRRIALCGVCTVFLATAIVAFEWTSHDVLSDSASPDIAKTRASMFAEVPKLAEDYTRAKITGDVRKMYRLTASLQVDSLDALTRGFHKSQGIVRTTEFLSVTKPRLQGPKLALVFVLVRLQRKTRDGRWTAGTDYECIRAVREDGAWRVYHMVHTEKLEFPCHVDILLNSSLDANPRNQYRAMNIDRPIEIVGPTGKPRNIAYDTWGSAEVRRLRSQGKVLWPTIPDLIRISGTRYYFAIGYVVIPASGQPTEADYEMCAEKYRDIQFADGWYWRLVSIRTMGSRPVTDPFLKAKASSPTKAAR
jgi:hypothetical protein